MSGKHRRQNVWVFFETERINKLADDAVEKRLLKFGAFVRSDARRSIRKEPKGTRRERNSKPGAPPLSHTGNLRENIFFGLDKRENSVVIGPHKNRSGYAPEALEYGGRATINGFVPKVYTLGDRGAIGRDKAGRVVVCKLKTAEMVARANRFAIERNDAAISRTVKIEARPYMSPAFERNLPHAPQLFRNSLK